MKHLDKTRTFGHVYGHPVAHFEQDNKLFDVKGNLITESEAIEAEAVEIMTATEEKRPVGRPPMARKLSPFRS